tara:strand:+ start:450 stop:608 length:159 start_codon:yes stop_codon:yes gene_type:complete
MGKSKEMYAFYFQQLLMNVDVNDVYQQQDYYLNKQDYDQDRINTESIKESLQ